MGQYSEDIQSSKPNVQYSANDGSAKRVKLERQQLIGLGCTPIIVGNLIIIKRSNVQYISDGDSFSLGCHFFAVIFNVIDSPVFTSQ